MYQHFVKRILDIMIGLLMLIIASPVILISMLTTYMEDPGPVIFKQRRLGYHGKEFTIYKLRTMRQNVEFTGSGVYSAEDDPRLLKTGRIYRRFSIDELPQAINLINGTMSLIGPRPPLTYHPWPLEEYTNEQMHMFDVRPGITGWAQVNGRRTVEWQRRIEMSCYYADHVSFLLDCEIVWMTIKTVVKHTDNENLSETLVK